MASKKSDKYYPYGLETANSWTRENNSNNFLYNGGTERNQTSGYYDLHFRNYDAAIGRFMQVDPMSVSEMATYQYSGNNPVMFNDPLGDQYVYKAPRGEDVSQLPDAPGGQWGPKHFAWMNPGYGGSNGYDSYGVQSAPGFNSRDFWAAPMRDLETNAALMHPNEAYEMYGKNMTAQEKAQAASQYSLKAYGTITYVKNPDGTISNPNINIHGWSLVQGGPLSLQNATVNDIMNAFRDVFNGSREGAHTMSDFFDESGVSVNQSSHRKEFTKTFNNGIKLVYTLGYADKRIDTVMPYYPAASSLALGVGKGWSVDPMQIPTSYTIGRSTVNEAYPYAMTIYGTYGNNNRMATLYFRDVYAFMSFSAYVQGK